MDKLLATQVEALALERALAEFLKRIAVLEQASKQRAKQNAWLKGAKS